MMVNAPNWPQSKSAAMSEPRRSNSQRGDHQGSKLCDETENRSLFMMVGNRCLCLASAVVQVFEAGPQSRNEWRKKCVGVATFIKDSNKRSYFIRVYDVYSTALQLEQEMYRTFEYSSLRPFFHTFESDDSVVGLNFADDEEAANFYGVVRGKIDTRRAKQQSTHGKRRKAAPNSASSASSLASLESTKYRANTLNGGNVMQAEVHEYSQKSATFSKYDKQKGKAKEKDKKKGKLSKEDISNPTNFKHIAHVGWDKERGFALENLSPQLTKFFEEAGISKKELQDEGTRQFIYDFIDKNGGMGAIQTNLQPQMAQVQQPQQHHPQPPQQPPQHHMQPKANAGTRGVPAPPVPVRQAPVTPPVPPTPPIRARQPPSIPAPSPPKSSGSHASSRGQMSTDAPSPSGAPAPPPMPPPGTVTSAPPPPPPPPMPPMPPPLPPGGGGGVSGAGFPRPSMENAAQALRPTPMPAVSLPEPKNDLMEEIRAGKALKHVDPKVQEKRVAPPSDGRSALLDDIRKGVTLNRVEARPKSATDDASLGDGLARALRRALEERNGALNPSDSDTSDSDADEDDDDWDD